MNTSGEFAEFINRQNLEPASEENLRQTTIKILERTELLDGNSGSNCQLVVGEVQSGKTMSFTALIALAHDNDFPIVVVLAGTKDPLLMQTSNRLTRDLNADGNGGVNPWVVLVKPKPKAHAQNLKKIQKALSIWAEKDAPKEFKPTVVITALKNKTGLDSIAALMESLKTTFDLTSHPVLIVDDEGDEAGLNLDHANDDESTVYAAIKRLREKFSKHSYVMYTATPQGPLLISIQDTLSPKFVTMLKSGKNYLGGEELFLDENTFFYKEIDSSESQMLFDATKGAPPPPSLKAALAYYLLALYVAQDRRNPRPLSMLVHPSVKKDLHESYAIWVERILASWLLIFKNQSEDVYEIEKRNFFTPALEELMKTCVQAESLELDHVLNKSRWWIPQIEIRVVNSDNNDIESKDWMSKSGWILIGGNKLSRGFTIENLAVTYMPRSVGVGNADVIQQRGRFFGYKRTYKDLLRGWFLEEQISAYGKYVDHEKVMRKALSSVDSSNEPLTTWRRRFLLDPAFSPVRNQVISLNVSQQRLSLFKQHRLYDDSLGQEFGRLVMEFDSLKPKFQPMEKDLRQDYRNYFAPIELDAAFELLVDWPMNQIDRLELDEIIWAAKAAQELSYIKKAEIVFMDYDEANGAQHERRRSLFGGTLNPDLDLRDQSINNLFQGRDKQIAVNYPGDHEMAHSDTLTIQVHRVVPLLSQIPHQTCFALAVIMPKGLPGFVVERESS
jgi:hypothetical protein